MTRNKDKERADLADPFEATYVFHQPRPQKVGISGGEISVEYGGWARTSPLESGELFTSFAKLSAHGAPSEAKIRNWVMRFGLPLRSNPAASSAPPKKQGRRVMSVEDFRAEARYAHDLLRLYRDLREEKAGAIRDRAENGKHSYAPRLDQQFAEAYKANRHRWGLYAGDWPGNPPRPEIRGHMTLLGARAALAEILTGLVARIRLRVGIQDMRGFAPSWECPDLPSAIYLQFYRIVTKDKPIRHCEHCGQPFEATPSHKRFCNPSCKSGAGYHRRKERSEPARDLY